MITYVKESVVTAMKADHKSDLAVKNEQIRKLCEKIEKLELYIENLGGSLEN